MTWTTTPPDRPGWFWWREESGCSPYPVKVVMQHTALEAHYGDTAFLLDHFGGEWWPEPIALPWEQEKASNAQRLRDAIVVMRHSIAIAVAKDEDAPMSSCAHIEEALRVAEIVAGPFEASGTYTPSQGALRRESMARLEREIQEEEKPS